VIFSRVRFLKNPVVVEPITASRLAVLFPVGQRVRGRLLAKLDDEQYLLRLKGHTLMAKSSVDLEEGEPVSAIVLSTWPRLHLQIHRPPGNRQSARHNKQPSASDQDDEALQYAGRAVIDIRV
jgi:hypothetical protein